LYLETKRNSNHTAVLSDIPYDNIRSLAEQGPRLNEVQHTDSTLRVFEKGTVELSESMIMSDHPVTPGVETNVRRKHSLQQSAPQSKMYQMMMKQTINKKFQLLQSNIFNSRI